MKVRIAISISIALIAAAALGVVAREFANLAKDLPAVSDVSLRYSFDTPAERASFVRSTCILSAAVFGVIAFAALSIAGVIRDRRMKQSLE